MADLDISHDDAPIATTSVDVVGLRRTNAHVADDEGDGRGEAGAIEHQISAIPQRDSDATLPRERSRRPELSTHLKRQLSQIPQDDYDSERERAAVSPSDAATGPAPVSDPSELHGRRSGALDRDEELEFEECGLMRIDSRDPTKSKRSDLERHISAIPDAEGRTRRPRGMSTRLQRTISNIPVDDYDSDDEQTVPKLPKDASFP